MASTVTVTVNAYPKGSDNTQRYQWIRGTIAIGAGSYPSGGLPLSFSGLEQIKAQPGTTAVDVQIYSRAASGYIYQWDGANIRILQSGAENVAAAPLVEVATTTPAGVVADTIAFTAMFVRD